MLRSRTMWFAYLLAIFGVLDANIPMFREMINPDWYGYIVTAIAMIVAILRVVTTKPLKER